MKKVLINIQFDWNNESRTLFLIKVKPLGMIMGIAINHCSSPLQELWPVCITGEAVKHEQVSVIRFWTSLSLALSFEQICESFYPPPLFFVNS